MSQILRREQFQTYLFEIVRKRRGQHHARRYRQRPEKRPAIPGLLFIRFPAYPITGFERGWAFLSRHPLFVEMMADEQGRPVLVPDKQMDRFRDRIERYDGTHDSDDNTSADDIILQAGQMVVYQGNPLDDDPWFKGFTGRIDGLLDKGRHVRLLISVFGRQTPVVVPSKDVATVPLTENPNAV